MKIDTEKIKMMYSLKGMNQTTFAEKAEMSRQGFNVLINKGSCAPESLIKIAKALEVDPSELLERN